MASGRLGQGPLLQARQRLIQAWRPAGGRSESSSEELARRVQQSSHRLKPALNPRSVQRQRDPWEPFRLWLALTIGLYALRAFFAAAWPGAIPGWVLLVMVLIALVLASKALLFPGRVVPYREGDGGWWNDLRDDWRLWWQRRRAP